jgi:MFS family permease
LTLGVHQAFGGVARMIGPLWSGMAFQHVGIRSPFWIAAAVMLLVRLFAVTVREDPTAPENPQIEPVLPSEAP